MIELIGNIMKRNRVNPFLIFSIAAVLTLQGCYTQIAAQRKVVVKERVKTYRYPVRVQYDDDDEMVMNGDSLYSEYSFESDSSNAIVSSDSAALEAYAQGFSLQPDQVIILTETEYIYYDDPLDHWCSNDPIFCDHDYNIFLGFSWGRPYRWGGRWTRYHDPYWGSGYYDPWDYGYGYGFGYYNDPWNSYWGYPGYHHRDYYYGGWASAPLGWRHSKAGPYKKRDWGRRGSELVQRTGARGDRRNNSGSETNNDGNIRSKEDNGKSRGVKIRRSPVSRSNSNSKEFKNRESKKQKDRGTKIRRSTKDRKDRSEKAVQDSRKTRNRNNGSGNITRSAGSRSKDLKGRKSTGKKRFVRKNSGRTRQLITATDRSINPGSGEKRKMSRSKNSIRKKGSPALFDRAKKIYAKLDKKKLQIRKNRSGQNKSRAANKKKGSVSKRNNKTGGTGSKISRSTRRSGSFKSSGSLKKASGTKSGKSSSARRGRKGS